MSCYHPLRGYRGKSGKLTFNPPKGVRSPHLRGLVTVACGQCIGCRVDRSKQWAVRVVHEAQLHEHNSFITLTYAPEHLPYNGSLQKADFQKFMKRLRKRFKTKRIRYYMCGEYGDKLDRPHYHAVLFGFDFPDKTIWKRTKSGSTIYRSQVLEELWPFGHSSVGSVTYESAAYVARYCMKKLNGDKAQDHYTKCDPETGEMFQIVPEYNAMSLKPAIGKEWFEIYRDDVYPHDYIVIDGKKYKPPAYYDKLLKIASESDFEDIKAHRKETAKQFERSDESLRKKEYLHKQSINRQQRNVQL